MWDLLISARCAVCGGFASPPLCVACHRELERLRPVTWIGDRPGMPQVRALGRHQGSLRTALLAWKEKGRSDLTQVFADLLLPHVAAKSIFVPVPTRWSSHQARGACVISSLAASLGAWVPVLRHQRRSQDQATLSAVARQRNVDQSLCVNARELTHVRQKVAQEHQIVVLDDVYTTGSTAREAVRALHEMDVPVTEIIVLAAAGQDRWRTGTFRV